MGGTWESPTGRGRHLHIVRRRFDVLWEEVRAAQRGHLLAVRSGEVLEWHYKRPLAHEAAWIYTVSEGDRLLAYAVFCRKNVAPIGPPHALGGLPIPRRAAGPAAAYAARSASPVPGGRYRRPREHRLATGAAGLLDRIAPWFRTMDSWQYFYKADSPELANLLRSRDVWMRTQYDGDACL